MTLAYNKQKGRDVERGTADYLYSCGFELAEPRRLAGAKDRGDIAGVRGWTIECKWGGARLDIPGWLRELEAEKENTGDPQGLLVVRPRGVTDPAKWWAIQHLEDAVEHLRSV